MMDTVLGDLNYCVYYIDDISIHSKSEAKHPQHVRHVLGLLQKNGLIVRFDKCQFGVSKVEFLGHEISAAGVRPLSNKVQAIKDFPTPRTLKELQKFNGMINYYHRFLPGIANTMAPLHDALKGKQKRLVWKPQHERAFQESKAALVSAATLTFPSSKAPLFLVTDASQLAVGGALEQDVEGVRQPIGFFSRKLQPAETDYSTFD